MPAFQSAELTELFSTYTASPDSIGAHLTSDAVAARNGDPLLVVTGTDLALYEGSGNPPQIEPYRLGGRGFRELAAVSHTGPALATLVRRKDLETGRHRGTRQEAGSEVFASWREDARRLAAASRRARAANSTPLWRDQIGVAAFAGREEIIARMTDYACLIGERGAEELLADPASFDFTTLTTQYLEGPDARLPVSLNRIMVATFFLAGLDLASRLLSWFDRRAVNWERLMVVVAGKSGRPTAGVTFESHSVARVIHIASAGRLDRTQILLAPHAPEFPPYDGDPTPAARMEGTYRSLWAGIHEISELGGLMFPHAPAFREEDSSGIRLDEFSTTVAGKPALRSPEDWRALTTRLRVVMEDPRQLLSGAVTDLAAHALVDAGGDPVAVVVPGLDGEAYPPLPR